MLGVETAAPVHLGHPASQLLGESQSLVFIEHSLDISVASDNHWALLVDRRGHDVQKSLQLAFEKPARGGSSCLLHDEGHGESLVEDPQLSLGRLRVSGVKVDAAVEDRAVNIGNHGANITGRVGLVAVLPFCNDGLNRGIPVPAVALVAAVDLLASALGHLDVGLNVHELAQGRVKSESMDSVPFESDDELSRCSVHAIAGNHDVVASSENVVDCCRLV
mmetsp:Transcript_38186/g.91215  ORF Transcript_38186/g.91215 Transcript_38186/m.91215 type:complete len:220 (+) Transcript_38186:84-743(+)